MLVVAKDESGIVPYHFDAVGDAHTLREDVALLRFVDCDCPDIKINQPPLHSQIV
jgi:hypothetical protein